MRDLLARRWSQLRERLGGNRWWLHELSRYYKGLPEEEFWVRYTLGRLDAAGLWHRKPRETEADYQAFYAESDYWLLRQMYYHRHSSFHWILRGLRAGAPVTKNRPFRFGQPNNSPSYRIRFCEYGSGVGPITAWLRRRHPEWHYTLVDVPSAMLDFAKWRFPDAEILSPGLGDDLPLRDQYDGIACLDVLEHVVNPHAVVRHLLDHLKPGGRLFINFEAGLGGDENLAESAAQREDTIASLNRWAYAVTPLRHDQDVFRGEYVA